MDKMLNALSRYIDRDGKPLTYREYFKLHSNYDYVRVGETYLDNPDGTQSRISTVWLGEPSMPYETMVFDGPMNQYTVRYATVEEAEVGHEKVVEEVKAALS